MHHFSGFRQPCTFHQLDINTMKSTGLTEALKMVHEARRRGLKILIGCMSETSCAIMAAAALAPQCDWADLDGPWLVTNNPFATPVLSVGNEREKGGKILLSEEVGLGIEG